MCHFRDQEHEWFAYEAEREARGESPPPELKEEEAVFSDEEPAVDVDLDREGPLATDD